MSWLSSCNRWLRTDAARRPSRLRRCTRRYLLLEQLEDRCVPAVTITELSANLADGAHPYGIVAGPDGTLWFTESGAGRIGRIGRITADGTITEYADGISGGPRGIAAGFDGNLWFTEGDRIGRITRTGAVTEYTAGLSADAGLK